MSSLPAYEPACHAEDGPDRYVAMFRTRCGDVVGRELDALTDFEAIHETQAEFYRDHRYVGWSMAAQWGDDLEEIQCGGDWGVLEDGEPAPDPRICTYLHCSAPATHLVHCGPAPDDLVPLPYCARHVALMREQAEYRPWTGRPPLVTLGQVIEIAPAVAVLEVA